MEILPKKNQNWNIRPHINSLKQEKLIFFFFGFDKSFKISRLYAFAFCWCLNTSPLSYPKNPSHSTWHFKTLFEDSTSPTPKPLFLVSVLFKNIERTLGNTEGNSSGDWRCVSFPSSVDPMRQQLICAPPPHSVIANVPKWQRPQTPSG